MKYFSLPELCHSVTAKLRHIDNLPDIERASNLAFLVDNLLDPLREAFGEPIVVQSGYRCRELNKLVSGVPDSYHIKGLAADISAVGQDRRKNQRLVDILKGGDLPYDQLILYDTTSEGPRWIHVALRLEPSQNRYAVLRR